MSQTQPTGNNKPTAPVAPTTLGAQAAAAVAGTAPTNGAAKPADTTAKPADAVSQDADKSADDASDEAKRGGNKVYVVVGQVHEFESAAKAEKFLNAEGAPTEYSVLKGKRLHTNKRVSLR